MRIFDSHTHVFPDAIAQHAIEHLRDKSHGIPTYTDGTAADLEVHALHANYTGWLNCPVVTSARQMRSVNVHVATTNAWPHLSLGGLYPKAPMAEVLESIREIQRLGLYGVKFHPEYQSFRPLDEGLAPMWEALSDAGLPVLFHGGRDIAFPASEQHATPGDYAELARRFPKLTIICAHLGGWLDWDRVEKDLVGAPVYLDTSFAKLWMWDQAQFERIILAHGTDRILFGTDSPWRRLEDGVQEILDLSCSQQAKEDIFWNNAARIFPLPT